MKQNKPKTEKYPEKNEGLFFNLERRIAVINIISNMKAIKVN